MDNASGRLCAKSALGLLLCGILTAVQAAPPQNQVATIDVALQEGMLLGQCVNRHGKPLSGHGLRMRRTRASLLEFKTDSLGRFAISGLSAGGYTVESAQLHQPIRVWQENVAPPNARRGVLLVEGAVLRGQDQPSRRAHSAATWQSYDPHANGKDIRLAQSSLGTYTAPTTPSMPPPGLSEVGTLGGQSAGSFSPAAGGISGGMAPTGASLGSAGGSFAGAGAAAGAGGALGAGIFSTPVLIGAGVAATVGAVTVLDEDDAS